jgi:Ca2+-binding RTX toxin-like protein
MYNRKRPSQRVEASGQHPPFPRRAGLWVALGLTALSPGAALAAFPANINLGALTGTNGFRLSGVAAGDVSGRAVSTAGDVNGDGVDDLLIGAPGADPNGGSSGASYVVFGNATPPPPVTCNGLPATIFGTLGNDTLFGTPGDDVIHGRGGNDFVRGVGGNDVICGGAGNDRLFGNRGRDRLVGGAGNDVLKGGPNNDRLLGQRGGDTMDGGLGPNDNCNGGGGTDTATSCEQPRGVP